MELTEQEIHVMINLMSQNGCKCNNENREYFWSDIGTMRQSECKKCGVRIAVPVIFYGG